MGFTGCWRQDGFEGHSALTKELGFDIWLEAGKLPMAGPSLKPWEICHKLEYEICQNVSDADSGNKIDREPHGADGEFLFSKQLLDFIDNLEHRHSDGAAELPSFEYGNDSSRVLESELVRNSLYALQGVASAVNNLENLSKAFSSQPADRSSHRIPSLWLWSSSTNALGKLLSAIAQAGRIRCQLGEFVEYILGTRSQIDVNDKILSDNRGDGGKGNRSRKKSNSKGKKENRCTSNQAVIPEVDLASSPPFSLVSQAFAIALKSILQGYLAALNTLTASVNFRHVMNNEGQTQTMSPYSSEAGCLTSVVSREVTLLELYLHTGELRTHIQALGAICMLKDRQPLSGLEYAENKMVNRFPDFQDFPRGADLLTYLYNQLRDADPIHHELLKFLFARACRPYSDFIRSWLYRADVKDPYKEFIVEGSENIKFVSHAGTIHAKHFPVSKTKVRDRVSIPCFLKDACTPLLRAGQQLQVLITLLETGEFGRQIPSFTSGSTHAAACPQLSNLEAILDCWSYFSNENASCEPVLVYSKRKLEEMMQKREKVNQQVLEKLDKLFAGWNSTYSQKGHRVVPVSCVSQEHHKPEGYRALSQNMHHLEGKASYHTNKRNDISGTTTLDFEAKETDKEYSSEVLEEDSFQELGTVSDDAGSSHSDEEELTSEEDEDLKTDNAHNGSPVVSAYWLKTVSAGKIHERCNDFFCTEGLRQLDDSTLLPLLTGKSKAHENVIQGSNVNDKAGSQELLDSGVALKNWDSSSFSGLSKSAAGYRESESLISDYQRGTSWPRNGLPANPFLDALTRQSKSNDYLQPYFTDIYHAWDITFLKCLERGPLHNMATHISESFVNNRAPLQRSPLELKISKQGHYSCGELVDFSEIDVHDRLDCHTSCSLMRFHPMLTRNAWSHLRYLMPDTSLRGRQSTLLPYYDFSAVSDLSEIFKMNLHCKEFAAQVGCMENGEPIEVKGRNHEDKGTPMANSHEQNSLNLALEKTRPVGRLCELDSKDTICNVRSSGDPCFDSMSNIQSKDTLARASGGSKWETSLRYIDGDDCFNMEKCKHDSETLSEIPLEVVVDKCIVQEVLLQYQCISKFTVKLLEEGFGLHGHLLALRRYFFMEVADWADAFIMSLCQHKWSPMGSHQRLLEVQAMLESALQRSSCEGDECQERLHIYIKVAGGLPQTENSQSCLPAAISASSFVDANCVNAFDFLALGYKVDWPLNIILAPDALDIYTAIFSFLMKIKLTVFSLSDIWDSLKELMHCLNKGQEINLDKEGMEQFRILMQFRQQVSHFVAALQQYIQSQLLHVVWYNFLHLLQHQVEDMVDLESVHKSYLCDSLRICFLSSQMMPVMELINNIMQCVLDFRCCFSYQAQSYKDGNSFKMMNNINYSRVLEVKGCFEQNLKKLYERHIKFSEQSEMSLSYLWMYLDYNEFVSSALSRRVPTVSK